MKKLLLLAVSALSLAACQQPADNAAKPSKDASKAAAFSYERDILPADATPVSYDIAVKPDIDAKTFEGEAKLTFMVNKATDRIVVNAINLDVAEAMLDGETALTVEVDADAQRMTFVAAEPISAGEHHIDVSYTGRLYDNAAGIFISTYPTPEGRKSLLASQMEPGDARKVAPMWDEPALKAVFKMSAILPEGMMAVSNMPVENTTTRDDGLVRTDFAPTPKMSSYLLYFGTGDFDRITQDYHGMELGIVTRAGESEKGRYALNATVDILDYYYDYFDEPYPLPKLDQIAAPGAGGFSAMENWGAILYFEQALLLDPRFSTPASKQRVFNVVAHEVAHQWFGNLVTMEWWDDLWLNESFASWMDSKISDHLNPDWNVWLQMLGYREYAFIVDSIASTHPISQPVHNMEEATTAFDGITYAKGQMVIRMIEDYVGEEAFRKGVRNYIKKHAYGNARMDDLWGAIDAASDAPVLDIAHDFTLQPGVPMIVVDGAVCENGATKLSLHQTQYGADAASKAQNQTWRTPVKAAVVGSNDIARATISGGDVQTMSLKGCGAVKVNAGESGYYRTLYTDESFGDISGAYDDLASIDQLGLIKDAAALGSTGYAPYSRFLDLVVKTPTDGEPVITGDVAGNLVDLNDLFKGQPGADRFKAFAADWLNPAFANVGWDAVAGESDNTMILRSQMIGALSAMDDEAVIAEVKSRFAAYRADPASLNPALVSRVIDVVGRKADETIFNQLLEAARNADNPREQRLYYGALDGVEDEALARRAMEIFLSDEISAQLRPRYFRSMADDHPRMIWDYYKEHYQEIEADLDPLERIEYAASIAASTGDEEIGRELEAFAAEHLPESAKKSVERAVQFITLQASIKRERLPEVVAWLEARGE